MHETGRMAKTIQIRNVPEPVLRRLKARAAADGMSLSEHLLVEVTRLAQIPTRKQMQERLAALGEVKLSKSAAQLVRRERDSA
jgi:plasmid stability protein